MTLARPENGCGLRVSAPPALPLDQLVLGKPVVHVLETLPRIFNLCKTAQGVALRMACHLPVGAEDIQELHHEILRDHQMRLSVLLPAQLGIDGAALAPIPPDMGLDQALATSPLLAHLAKLFAPGEACVAAGPENSVADRQAECPVMQSAEARFGRGPLWRVLARYTELENPIFPTPVLEPSDEGDRDTGRDKGPHKDGDANRGGNWAVVPAARGSYRLRARVEAGKITAFARRTPTDDMLCPGGRVDQSLASLPRAKAALAPLVLDILDPCVPLTLKEAQDA